MATAEVGRARVVLEADRRGFNRDLDAAERKAHATGRALKGALVVGAAAAAGGLYALGRAAKIGFDEFNQGQRAAAQTNAVLKSTGGIANVTAKDVDRLARSLLNKTGIDDEAIKSGENMLLTFTRVRNEVGRGNDVFDQATKLAVDLSVATGKDLVGANVMLGKALNDPVRGITALTRVGVTFDNQQREQIKTLVAHGQTLQAQKIILAELRKEFGGSAEAAGKTFGGQLNILRERLNNFLGDVVGRAMPTLARLLDNFLDFVPTIERFANTLLDRIGPALRTAGEVFRVLGNYWRTTWLPIVRQLGEILGNAVTRIGAVVQAHMPAIRELFRNLGETIRSLWAVAGPLLRLLFEQVLPRVIGIAIEALAKISGVVRVLAGVFRGSVSTILLLLDKFLGGIQLVAEGAGHLPFVGGKFDGVARAVGRARDRVRELKDEIDGVSKKNVKTKVRVEITYSIGGRPRPSPAGPGGDGLVAAIGDGARAFARAHPPTFQEAFGIVPASATGSAAGLKPMILDDLALGRSMGLSLSSGYRPGAITSSGNVSLHATGQAIDMVGSPGQMASYAHAEAGRSGIAEVIYSPVGWWHPGSGWGPVTDPEIRAGHFSHVHVGARSGDGRVGARGDGRTPARRPRRPKRKPAPQVITPGSIKAAEGRARGTPRLTDDIAAYQDEINWIRGQLKRRDITARQRSTLQARLGTVQGQIARLRQRQADQARARRERDWSTLPATIQYDIARSHLTETTTDDLAALRRAEAYLVRTLKRKGLTLAQKTQLIDALVNVRGQIADLTRPEPTSDTGDTGDTDTGDIGPTPAEIQADFERQATAYLQATQGLAFGGSNIQARNAGGGSSMLGPGRKVTVIQHFNKPPEDAFPLMRSARFAAEAILG